MATFKSMNDIKKYIQAKVNESLLNDVVPAVREVMIDQIDKTVYDAYKQPEVYERRNDGNELRNENSIGGYVLNNTLEVYNAAPANPDIYERGGKYESQNAGEYLAPIIEYGEGYDFPSEEAYNEPRPFVSNTREQLKEEKQHVTALKNGLKSKGLNVK